MLTLGLIVVLVLLIAVGGVYKSKTTKNTSAASAGTDLTATEATEASNVESLKGRLGVFTGTDVDATQSFEDWIGRKITYAVDFGTRENWSQIANPSAVLAEWKDSGYRLVLAVPMLPTELISSDLSDSAQQTLKKKLMGQGGDGDYNEYFVTLAENLVAADQSNAILRVGWEMNIEDWPWGTDDPDLYIDFYRQIVKSMRSVDGADFEFDWNVNNGFNPNDGEDYYPGDKYVDYVGVDVYDLDSNVYPYPKKCNDACREKRQTQAWEEAIYGSAHGLGFWTEFAAEHDKPVSLPEWALWDRYDDTGGADNPNFIKYMHDYITRKSNNVAYANYFNYNSEQGDHSITKSFPKSKKVFLKLFGGSD